MEPVSRLLLRNRTLLEAARRILWLNPPADCPWGEIAPAADRLALFCQDRGTWRRMSAAGADVTFGVLPDPAEPFDCVILTLPREKSRLQMMVHLGATLLTAGGRLLLAGENRAGIKSSASYLEPWFQSARRADSARHCVLYCAQRPRAAEPFDLEAYRRDWELLAPQVRLKIRSWPGVFAHGGLDAGTRLLLNELPVPGPGARVLDFACGAGVLGAAVLQRHPGVHCTLADVDALACHAARSTLHANGLRGEVIASDGFSDLHGHFDLIVSNPPFHRGHRAVRDLTTSLLDPVRNFLNPGGQFVMVANRHLPYRRWLDEVFGAHVIAAADQRYHVLSARLPAGQATARTRRSMQ